MKTEEMAEVSLTTCQLSKPLQKNLFHLLDEINDTINSLEKLGYHVSFKQIDIYKTGETIVNAIVTKKEE